MIRAYQPSDRDDLLQIWKAASRSGHPFLSEVDLARQHDLVRDVYLPSAENWVSVSGTNPEGFIGLIDNFIGGLFVDPIAARRGVGAALVHHAAKLKGSLEVDVYALNAGAHRFYHRLGFIETSRRPADDEGRALEIVRMQRPG